MELEQLEVKTAFLHGDLEETIYMSQPKGFEVNDGKHEKVCLLKRSLYGLKQSPRQWYKRFDLYVLKKGFSRSAYDNYVYFKEYEPEFEMKELGEAKKILRIEIERDRVHGVLKLSQHGYMKKILERYSMEGSKPVITPLAKHFKLSKFDCPNSEEEVKRMLNVPYSGVVGSLMYLTVCTGPDISHAVSLVSRYLSNLGKNHWEAAKWIMKYIKGTSDVGLVYEASESQSLCIEGFVDSDFAGDKDKCRSLSGYVFQVFGCTVSWKASLQHIVALSCTEAEYIALTKAVKEAMWIKGLTSELGIREPVAVISCDNQSAMHLSKNPMYHERSKHIDVRMHFIRDVIEAGTVGVMKVHTSENPADMLTKALSRPKFKDCLRLLKVGTGGGLHIKVENF